MRGRRFHEPASVVARVRGVKMPPLKAAKQYAWCWPGEKAFAADLMTSGSTVPAKGLAGYPVGLGLGAGDAWILLGTGF